MGGLSYSRPGIETRPFRICVCLCVCNRNLAPAVAPNSHSSDFSEILGRCSHKCGVDFQGHFLTKHINDSILETT